MQSLSLYRTELMGLAAILIIVCHSTQGPCPIDSVGVLHKLVVAGNYGVDIFLLLSGVGLCYSLEHLYEGEGSLKRWYKRRFIRIMVPYFILVVPWWGIVCIMEGVEFRTFLWRVSTMSYWTNHDGVWFLSMLLPLYLFTPFYGWLVKKSVWHQSCLPAIFILAIICFGPRAYELQPLDKTSVFANISFCLVRLPSFFVGYWAASYVKKGTEIPIWLAIVIPLVGIVIAHYYYNRLVSLQHLFSSLLIVSIAICLFKCLCVGGGRKLLFFMGTISLESYLANHILISFVSHLPPALFDKPILTGGYLVYGFIAIVGTLMAWCASRLSARIIRWMDT